MGTLDVPIEPSRLSKIRKPIAISEWKALKSRLEMGKSSEIRFERKRSIFLWQFQCSKRGCSLSRTSHKNKNSEIFQFPFSWIFVPCRTVKLSDALHDVDFAHDIQLSTKVCPNHFVILSHKVSREVSITEVFNLRY